MKRVVRADDQGKEAASAGGGGGGGGGGGVVVSHHPSYRIAYNTTTAATAATTIKVLGANDATMQSSLYTTPTQVTYGSVAPAASKAPGASATGQAMAPLPIRTKGSSPPATPAPQQQQSPGGSSFQRLKVEDALSYLDMVKYKFGKEPQVYNDFLDIMKEFKSQSIDTPGVIHRVSSLFHGYPELIVGFNTFLPPGYKIEVQHNDGGYAFHVSVSAPNAGAGQMVSEQPKSSMILSGSGTIIHSAPSAPPPAAPVIATVATVAPGAPAMSPQQQVVAQQSTTTLMAQIVPTPSPAPTASKPAAVSASALPPFNAGYASLPTGNGGGNSGGGGGGGGNNLISQNTLQLSAVTQALQGTHSDAPQNQPVEFNHAINYVNKIKNRFQGQPEKYKRFLEILHTYQKEQRTLKEVASAGPGGKHLTEQEVYSQVAKLFENQSDLLAEFGQFLPDATSHIAPPSALQEHIAPPKKQMSSGKPAYRDLIPEQGQPVQSGGGAPSAASSASLVAATGAAGGQRHHVAPNAAKPSHALAAPVKRSPPYSANPVRDAPPPKKHKMSSCRDVTLSEAAKHSTLAEFAFFDKVRKAVRSHDVYNNFLRCLFLFNQEIISKTELVQLVTPFLSKFPELMRWFRDFLGQHEVESIPYQATRIERPPGSGENAHDIDYSTAKRLGASYCVIPPSQEGLKFSGRTALCNEVLNNQWVSFPTWSEDSSFVGSRKNQYEEYMYRCEDERFELDVVIETNASTIRVLEGVAKKMSRMSQDDLVKFRLDDCLGGSSPVLQQRALKRIYGDKAQDIIDGLKRNPPIAVPVILRRLKSKEEEWREAQKGFNKIWREQNEKHYLKSLDYQSINFKPTDTKSLRSKNMLADIEQAFEERNDQIERGLDVSGGPHWTCAYTDRHILDDAANLLIHHVKRHTTVQKGEKRRMKNLLRQFLPDLFFHPRQQFSDDEREEEEEKDEGNESPNSDSSKEDTKKTTTSKAGVSPGKSPRTDQTDSSDDKHSMEPMDIKEEDSELPLHAQTNDPDEEYTLFMANSNWYLFLRLHAVLCERLTKIYECAARQAADENRAAKTRKESTALALRLKPKPQIRIEDYFPTFLDLVKNLLDGNTDVNTYEDTLREMFGIQAYIAFTLDKVIQYAMRQLQNCVTEKLAITAMELFLREQKRGAAGGPCASAHRRAAKEAQYQRAMERAAADENYFKIYIYKNDGRMSVELIEPDNGGADGASGGCSGGKKPPPEEAKTWSNYKEDYVRHHHHHHHHQQQQHATGAAAATANNERKLLSPLYLGRNMRKYNKKCGVSKRRTSTNSDKAGGGGGGTEDEAKESKEFDVSDETQCRFDPGDTKIVFVTNKDSFLYKRNSLTRAKQTHRGVTMMKAARFRAWCRLWLSANVTEAASKACHEWLMGRSADADVKPHRTRIIASTDLSRTPYTTYNRYRVEYLPTTAATATAADIAVEDVAMATTTTTTTTMATGMTMTSTPTDIAMEEVGAAVVGVTQASSTASDDST